MDAGDQRDTGSKPRAPVRVVEPDAACAMQSARAVRGIDKQVDIVFVVDNSGSMTEEIAAIRANINENFAAIIEESGVDYQVVMLSLFGTAGTTVCVEPPLAGAACDAGLYASTGERFFQYNEEIDSSNSLCMLLQDFDAPDLENRAPTGYQSHLRTAAQKAFVVITDDSASCSVKSSGKEVRFGMDGKSPFEDALSFHEALLAKSPEQFGTPPNVRYSLYSIVGMAPHEIPDQPWFPHEGLNERACDTAPSAGLTYQALSVITDALRYPVCEGRGFDAVLRVLARNVIEASKADCKFELPEPPPGQSISRRSINVEYLPGGDGEAARFGQVETPEACDERSFLVRDDLIELCPDACGTVEADPAAVVNVLYACNLAPQ
jgi:hypothetical protein